MDGENLQRQTKLTPTISYCLEEDSHREGGGVYSSHIYIFQDPPLKRTGRKMISQAAMLNLHFFKTIIG